MKDNTTKKKSNNRKTKKKYIDCYEQPIYSLQNCMYVRIVQ